MADRRCLGFFAEVSVGFKQYVYIYGVYTLYIYAYV